MLASLSNIGRRLRREGFFGSTRLLCYRLSRRLLGLVLVRVYEKRTDVEARSQTATQFHFSWLEPDDVRSLEPECDGLLPGHLAGRIDEGASRCLAAWESETGVLAGFVWLAGRDFPPEWIYGPQVQMWDDRAYLYNAVTLPKFRGQRVFCRLVDEAADRLRAEGVTRVFLTVEIDNTVSHRAVLAAGFEDLGLHAAKGMPFGKVFKRSKLDLPVAKRPAVVLRESDAFARE